MSTNAIDYDFARRVVMDAEASIGPVSESGILPAEAYISEDFWKFEKQAIFSRAWLCIGHVNEVPTVGDYIQLRIMDEPVLMVRTDNDKVRVLSSICQHRGHPIVGGVVDSPPNGRCSHANRLVCPYHNWTYSLNGELLAAPSMDETVPLIELKGNIRLPAIRTEIFHGLVFINFDEKAPPVAEKMKKLDAEFTAYALADLVPGHVFALEKLEWNWKLHHENALESYHTTYVHRDYHSAVPASLTRFRDYECGDGQVMRTAGYKAENGDLFEAGKVRRLPDIPGLSEEQRSRVLFVSLMPCAVAVLQPSMVTVTFINPTSPGTMNSRRVNLYVKAATEVPDFERIRDEQFAQLRVIIEQDQVTQEALQRAYHSRFKPRGRLSHLETAITQLNQWVVERYREALPAASEKTKAA